MPTQPKLTAPPEQSKATKFLNDPDIIKWCLANFVVLSLFGALLRYMVVYAVPRLTYMNILHAHSHFAFSAWIFLALSYLLIKQPHNKLNWQYNCMFIATVICSFGMLISFSLQGYKAVSILFSTLFLFVTYWFVTLASRQRANDMSLLGQKLKAASLFFLALSSLGPFALGALKANGYSGPWYQNAIYFYLHFQLNGWMVFAALALIFKGLNPVGKAHCIWTKIFIWTTVPLYVMFTLWHKSFAGFYGFARIIALINAASWFMLVSHFREPLLKLPWLLKIALIAFSIKEVFQIFICIPVIGEWVFLNRNLIIGYVHLITLGCVTPVVISELSGLFNFRVSDTAKQFYVFLTIAYLLLLFLQPLFLLLGVTIPHFHYCLFIISILYCLWGIRLFANTVSMPFQLSKNKVVRVIPVIVDSLPEQDICAKSQ